MWPSVLPAAGDIGPVFTSKPMMFRGALIQATRADGCVGRIAEPFCLVVQADTLLPDTIACEGQHGLADALIDPTKTGP